MTRALARCCFAAAIVAAFLLGGVIHRLVVRPLPVLGTTPLEVSAAVLWHGAPKPKLSLGGRLTTETVQPTEVLTSPATGETLARVADYCAPMVTAIRRDTLRRSADSLSHYPLSRETLALASRLRFGVPTATDTARSGPPLPGPRPLPDVDASPLVRAPALLPPFRGRVTRDRLELWAIRGDGSSWRASYPVRLPAEFLTDRDSLVVRQRRRWLPDPGLYAGVEGAWPAPELNARAGVQATFGDAWQVRAGGRLTVADSGTVRGRLTAGIERTW